MNEDYRMSLMQEDEDKTRKERDRTDAIIDARHDLITEAKTLRRLQMANYTDDIDGLIDESHRRLGDITDRLNELEGDTA